MHLYSRYTIVYTNTLYTVIWCTYYIPQNKFNLLCGHILSNFQFRVDYIEYIYIIYTYII